MSSPDEPGTGPRAHTPYVPADSDPRELTIRAVVLGTLLGMVFGASSLFLVLKVGLTVSASIPVAVISVTFFRLLSKLGFRDATILENNIVQTAGSAGESIAFGTGVTMPAILILGFSLELTRVALVAVLGGLLGILMMIPLRRALIVQQHGVLKYPEGTACAEVLKAGDAGSPTAPKSEDGAAAAQGMSAKTIFSGFAIGLLYKSVMVALKGWKDVPEKIFGPPLAAGSISAEISPELLGVGYIIGPKISSVMCAGGVLAYLLLIPLIKFFGEGMALPLAPGKIPIAEMTPDDIRGAYVLYIGAGAVAAGGIVSLARSFPTIVHGLREGLRDFRAGSKDDGAPKLRTEVDLSMRWVLVGILGLVAVITLAPQLHMNLLGALLVIVFGFLFVTVSSRLTGEIGSSSNPISGMTVATLLFTCIVFVIVGWTGPRYYVTALSVGAIVCIAASNGGTTSQDLKTGFLLGATPKRQQVSILIGALASALVLGPILLRLNDSATVYVPLDDAARSAMHAPASQIGTAHEPLAGPQHADDAKTYRVWNKQDEAGGPAGQYLVDDAGEARYLKDPGINGVHKTRPDGTPVPKFDAPKATLMSYIIKGILDHQLPWTLVLFGVMIALVLEMSGIPSLAFAVGVYLPLSSSTPILVGGCVRWLVDKWSDRKRGAVVLTEDERNAESDKSPGVLMASGYIAGGAIAGIVIAFSQGVFGQIDAFCTKWSTAHNPMFQGPNADLLSMIPFALLTVLLWLAGAELILRPKRAALGGSLL